MRRVRRVRAAEREVEARRLAVRSHGRAVDPVADLEPLAVQEAVAALVGDREVRGPRRRELTPLGPEDHVFEPVAGAVRGAQVAGVVPPLGQPVVRAVVAREDDRLRVGDRDGRRRSVARQTAAVRSGWPGSGRRRHPSRSRPGSRRAARRAGRRPGRGDGRVIGSRPRPRPPTRAAGPRRSVRGWPASTSSSGRGAASWPAPAAPG